MNIPDFLHGRVSELIAIQADEASRKNLWAVILKAKVFPDGDQWCCLYGENIQDGICAFGSTPVEAMYEFDSVMYRKR